MSRVIWLGMQANEDEAKADCGCTLYRCDDESDDPFYLQCALHHAAPALLAACEAIVLTDRKRVGITVNPHDLYLKAVALAKVALAAAKGE